MQRRPAEVDIPRIPVLRRGHQGVRCAPPPPAPVQAGGWGPVFPSDQQAPLVDLVWVQLTQAESHPHVMLLGAGFGIPACEMG